MARVLSRLFGLLLLALLLSPTGAQAWWNKDWAMRMKITADASPTAANITEPIGRAPILVRLHAGNFDFSGTREDGGDLRMISGDDKTPLHYHVEKFSQKDQVALVWVDLPDMAPGTVAPFFVYWGNANAADGSDPRGTFDPDTLLVYHFSEENGLPKDTTGFGINALTAATRDEAGMIGYGTKLDREKPLLRISKNPALAIPEGQAMTVSMWAQPDPAALTSSLFSDREAGNALTIGLEQGALYAQIDGPAGTKRVRATAALPAQGWHHIAVEVTDKISLFVDGQPVGEGAGSLPAISGQPVLGGAEAAGSPRYVGLIDEFRISKIARPVGALQASVASEGPDGKLIHFENAEQGNSDAPGFMTVILRSVTIDAWVVIGLLAIVAFASWYVMYAKTTYLNRLGVGNRAFLTEYEKLLEAANGDHIAVLNQIAANNSRIKRNSGLQRLTRIAVREMEQRLNAGRLQPGGSFSPQSLTAIQAAMETGLAHEQHMLSNLMVMLTIAISGGPFIGLLGTVIGVMITFASIAAAGDVNINAIAPGIAAALLATAAGMFVAIPAMFAYNYLLIRIKGATGDMGAFCNETIARMGEARALMRTRPIEPEAASVEDTYVPEAPVPIASLPKAASAGADLAAAAAERRAARAAASAGGATIPPRPAPRNRSPR